MFSEIFNVKLLFLLFFLAIYSFSVSIFNSDRRSTVNRLFIILMLSSSINNLIGFLAEILQTPGLNYTLSGIGNLGQLACPILYLHFSMAFPSPDSRVVSERIRTTLIPLCYFLPICYLTFFYSCCRTEVFHQAVAVYQLIFMFSALWVLGRKLELSKFELKRQQLTWVILAFSFNFILMSVLNFLESFTNLQFYLENLVSPVLLFFLLSPPILEFNWDNFNFLIRRSFTYVVVMVLLLVFFLFMYEQVIVHLGERVKYGYLLDILLLLSIFIAFQPFRNTIYQLTGKFFSRDWARYEEEILSFSKECLEILEPEMLVDLLRGKLVHVLKPERVEIVLDPDGVLEENNPGLYDFLMRHDFIDLRSEADRNSALGIDLPYLIPLKKGETLHGYIALGLKKNGNSYNEQDLTLLRQLSLNTNIALHNSLLFKNLEETNQKLMAASGELADKEKKLQEADRMVAIGRMTTQIAHEIKNPLGIIRLSADELNEQKLQPEAKKLVTYIHHETEKLTKFMNNLLFFTADKVLNPQKIELPSFLKTLLEQIMPQALYPGITLHLDLADSHIFFDPEKLKTVVSNLVINATEAMFSKGNIFIHTRTEQGFVLLEISNDGPEIPAGIRDQIFRPFFTTKIKGGGLGLAIVKQILGKGNALISIESSATLTTFSLKFPGGEPCPKSW
ncbi:MAG: HAMP domain-containing sensor histidine kinase [Candidatus Wallbacteria bacterium]|nr:HAMP domain-containing sensor histidine kinase [Candidatus Wallbacteria bacterium]